MDSLITAAARALAVGDPLGALNRVALREDAPGLALRGIAMAQLGDFARAKALLRSASRAFGAKEARARARCIVAEAEVALLARDLGWPVKALDAARLTLEAHGDRLNAAQARNLQSRRLLLIGRLDEAEQALKLQESRTLPPTSRAAHELVVAGIAMRRLQGRAARAALARAEQAARAAGHPALLAEVKNALRLLDAPAARLIRRGDARPLTLEQVETLFKSNALIVDACRVGVRNKTQVLALASRPVLFALLRALATAWPAEASREALVAQIFRAKRADESYRARLRVQVGRLRAKLRTLATVDATPVGFALTPRHGREVLLLVPMVENEQATLLAFLADGEAWSSSALATVLGISARTVQRALETLSSAGKVQSLGRGRARRWMSAPEVPFPTALLLPGPLPSD